MNGIKELLQHFSLSPQEADLYLLLLKHGQSNVTRLAHLQKRNRTAVYFHLNHLVEKGVVKETRVGRRTEHVALSPKELADRFERWTTEFKSFLPQLESLRQAEKERPIVEVLESSAGFRRIYDEISVMKEGSEFLVLEGKTALRGELRLLSTREWSTFFSRIVERKILTRGVFTEESLKLPTASLGESNRELLRSRRWDLRALPESALPLEHLLMIYGNKAAFLIPEDRLLFTLEHPGIVGILKSLFECIHGLATPFKNAWGKQS
jgi:sugar-specific transcriptional regulator TrmB